MMFFEIKTIKFYLMISLVYKCGIILYFQMFMDKRDIVLYYICVY